MAAKGRELPVANDRLRPIAGLRGGQIGPMLASIERERHIGGR